MFTYDKNNRLLSTTDPEQHAASQTYDDAGNILTKRDGENNTTTYSYDEFNRLESVLNPENETTSHEYDLNGNMLTQTDGKGNTVTFDYNVENKLKKRTDPGGANNPAKTESYTYYADGTIYTKLDRNGVTTTYTYDCHDRLLSQTAGALTVSYTYDGNGNQLTMTDSTGVTTRTYDERNRVLTKTVPYIGTTSYVYDIIAGVPAGYAAETSTDPKGNVTRKIYDEADRLSEVTAGSQTTTYAYYVNGNRRSVTYPNQYKEEYTYYANNLVWTLTNKKADGSTMDLYTYTYDGANNQTSKTETVNGVNKGMTSYAYDSLDRLETVTEPGGKTTSYTYDAAGNRLTGSVIAGSTTTITTYAYNEQNRLISAETSKAGGITERTEYGYDNNGNMRYSGRETVKPAGPEPEAIEAYAAGSNAESEVEINKYDEFNRLIWTATGDKTVTYEYNGEGYRTEKTVNGAVSRYLYEYDKVVLEVDGEGNQKAKNVYGTNLLMRQSGADTAYYMYNGHADVTALLDNTGTIQASYYYDAFGTIVEKNENEGISNPYRYAGYQYDDETSLYYLNARYYDSKIARFLSEDTYGGDASDPLSLNAYVYCSNNPIMYTDPTGHWQQGDENLTYQARVEISRLTDLYYSAKTPEEKKAASDAANAIRNNTANKASSPQNSTTGNRANKILDTTKNKDSNGNAYMTADEWRSISTTKSDDIVVGSLKDKKVTQSEINAVAASKPTNNVASSDNVITTNNIIISTTSANLPPWGYNGPPPTGYYGQSTYTNMVTSNTGTNISLDDARKIAYNIAWNLNIANDKSPDFLKNIFGPDIYKYSQQPSQQQAYNVLKNVFGQDYYDAAKQQDFDYDMQIVNVLGIIASMGADFKLAMQANSALEAEIAETAASVGKTASIKSNRAVVIGEGMGDIQTVAKQLKAEGINAKWYQAWGKNFPQNRPMTIDELNAALTRNQRWIDGKIKAGYDIYDIGIDPMRLTRSPFYQLEQNRISNFKYPTTDISWRRP